MSLSNSFGLVKESSTPIAMVVPILLVVPSMKPVGSKRMKQWRCLIMGWSVFCQCVIGKQATSLRSTGLSSATVASLVLALLSFWLHTVSLTCLACTRRQSIRWMWVVSAFSVMSARTGKFSATGQPSIMSSVGTITKLIIRFLAARVSWLECEHSGQHGKKY